MFNSSKRLLADWASVPFLLSIHVLSATGFSGGGTHGRFS
jgi:hypothetical protein